MLENFIQVSSKISKKFLVFGKMLRKLCNFKRVLREKNFFIKVYKLEIKIPFP